MSALLEQFVTEARDLLQEAGEDLLALERAPDDEVAINRLFRSVHTLKGSSGLFDAPALTQLLHAGEDLFQAVREHRLALTPGMVDLALKSFDQVGRWIEHLHRHGSLPADSAPTSKALAMELRACLDGGGAKTSPMPAAAPPLGAGEPPPDLARWFPAEALIAAATAAGDSALTLISYFPEESCFFKGEDPLRLALRIPDLRALSIEPRSPWSSLSTLDPFVCNLDFHALSTAGRGDLEIFFRYVPDQVWITEVPATTPAAPAAPGRGAVVRALLREQISLLALTAPIEEFAGRVASAARVATNVLRFGKRPDAATPLDAARAEAIATQRPEPLSERIASFLVDAAEATSAGDHPPAPRYGDVEPGRPEEPGTRQAPRTLRIDQEKVDALMNLVGELVVAKNSLPFLARRAEQQFGLRELGRAIKDQYGVMDRIAQELQGAVLAVRMMPVGQVFQRFPRLVRDLSRKLGKQVELVIEGGETEADKNVIESLFDPLLHMVRNSIDHGVEAPEDRVASGKPVIATIRLSARHDADHVVIEVVDDGRGIDPEVIKRKALERGLIDETRLATISDQDATMLVFAAGFSTAEKLSDVSGRGVGMDVVRNAVERAGGRIVMTSVKDKGTTVRLDVPLSMAVSRVMTVGLDGRLFGIPMDLIHETVRVPRREIARIKGGEAFVLRDRIVPIVHLAHLLDLPNEMSDAEEIAVLVVRVDGQTIGLGISNFGEGMDVILKPLEGMLAKIVGYMGTALLGDGRVLLVLDLQELIQ